MKRFLIKILGGYAAEDIIMIHRDTVESVNELLDMKNVQWEIQTRNEHIDEDGDLAGEIGIVACKRQSHEELLEQLRNKIDNIFGGKRTELANTNKKSATKKKRVTKKVAKKDNTN